MPAPPNNEGFNMDPATLSAIFSGLQGLGGAITGSGQRNADRRTEQERLAEQKRQFDAQQRQRAGETALSATQLDPLKQQKSRQLNALLAQLMQRMTPVSYDMEAGKFSGGFNDLGPEVFASIASFFGPDAMRSAENSFAANAGAASGGQYRAPDLGAAGYAPPTGRFDTGATTATPMPNAPRIPQGGPGTAVRRPGSPDPTETFNPFDVNYDPLKGSRTPRTPRPTGGGY